MKVCTKCKKTKPLSNYSPHKRAVDGKQSACKACMNKLLKEYYQINRIKVKKTVERYKKTNPEKTLAHNTVNQAIRDGKIWRPSFCKKCGLSCKPDGHHTNYQNPFDVDWLCRSCHIKIHLVCVEI